VCPSGVDVTAPAPVGNEPAPHWVVATHASSNVPSARTQQSWTVVHGVSGSPVVGRHVPVRFSRWLQTSATPRKSADGTSSTACGSVPLGHALVATQSASGVSPGGAQQSFTAVSTTLPLNWFPAE
jgi:hypothetical protein